MLTVTRSPGAERLRRGYTMSDSSRFIDRNLAPGAIRCAARSFDHVRVRILSMWA
jgi:hypothetical protein